MRSDHYMEYQNQLNLRAYLIFFFSTYSRIRLPEDRDPRYDRSPLFGINAAPDTDGMGVIRQGDAVMIWS